MQNDFAIFLDWIRKHLFHHCRFDLKAQTPDHTGFLNIKIVSLKKNFSFSAGTLPSIFLSVTTHKNFVFCNRLCFAKLFIASYSWLLEPFIAVRDGAEIGLHVTATSYSVWTRYKNIFCMHGSIHTRHMTRAGKIMTILNAGLPVSNKIMYDFRNRPGGPFG